MVSLSLDLETLGTSPGCAVISIGACFFDEDNGKVVAKLHHLLRIDEQLMFGMSVSQDTLEWWGRQSKECKESTLGLNPCRVTEALESLNVMFKTFKAKRVWGHGSVFDVSILQKLYEKFNIEVPWRYQDVRDTRTLFDLASRVDPCFDCEYEYDTESMIPHVALTDSINQANNVHRAIKLISSFRIDEI